MPVHDWTKVDAGIFHDFNHAWIEEIKRVFNSGLLPEDYYALAEQHTTRFGPDVLTLEATPRSRDERRVQPERGNGPASGTGPPSGTGRGTLLALPKAHLAGETDLDFYRRKQKVVAVRHVSGDDLVAVVEIVSPGNKAGLGPLRDFIAKAGSLISLGIHLLIIDLIPPSKRDPNGIHGAIWEEVSGQEYQAPRDKPLTLASYDASPGVRAYVEHLAVGDPLIEMPLFLEPGGHVPAQLQATYESAWQAVPRRWRSVIENEPSSP
jgi:hypothetical protein